eukprot:7378001-Prymnesium_polylepis.1
MSIWTCGQNASGQLGQDEATPPTKECLVPTKVSSSAFLSTIVQIACGDSHCLARDDLGNAYAWGRAREGQPCEVSTSPQAAPQLLHALEHESVQYVACGAQSCFAITAAGRVYAWGALYEQAETAVHESLSGYGRGLSGGELSERHNRIIQSSMQEYLGGDDDDVGGSGDGGGEPGGANYGTKRVLQSTPTPLALPPGASRPRTLAAGFGFL